MWSKEELERLCELVFKFLDVQRRIMEAGPIKKTHRQVRNSYFISVVLDLSLCCLFQHVLETLIFSEDCELKFG